MINLSPLVLLVLSFSSRVWRSEDLTHTLPKLPSQITPSRIHLDRHAVAVIHGEIPKCESTTTVLSLMQQETKTQTNFSLEIRSCPIKVAQRVMWALSQQTLMGCQTNMVLIVKRTVSVGVLGYSAGSRRE